MKKTLSLFLICAVLVTVGIMTSRVSAQIAPGVQQAAGQTATITGSVSLSDGTLVGGADVKLIGPAVLSTTTDAHGAFQFTTVPHGVYTIVASAGSLGTATKTNIAVNSDISVQVQYARASTTLKTIANVTTRAVGVHINVTAASVDSVAPRDYAFQGNTQWQQLLETIPGVAVNGGSWSGEQSGGVIGTPFQPQVVSINGATPYETATTLDGMPFTNQTFGSTTGGGAADFAVLPMSAFDGVDVVRGPGANSPSIVNSIGGSLVLHAPGAVTGNHVQFSVSNDAWGGINAVSLLQFKIGQKFSAQFGYDVYSSPGPAGHNARVLTLGIYCPLTVDGQAFYGAPGTYGFGECVGPPTPSNPAYFASGCNVYRQCYTYNDPLLIGNIPVDMSWIKHGYSAGFNYKVSPNMTAQLFYAGSDASDAGGSQAAFNLGIGFTPVAGYGGGVTAGLHFLDEAGYIDFPVHQSAWLSEERITANVGKSGILRLSALQNNSWFDFGYGSGFYHSGGNAIPVTLYGNGYYCSDPSCSSPGPLVQFNGGTYNATFPTVGGSFRYWSQNRDLLASYGQQIGSRISVGASFTQSYFDNPYSILGYTFNGADYCVFLPGYCAGQDPSIAETTREERLNAHFDVTDHLSMDASYYWANGQFHTGTCGQFNYFSVCHTYLDYMFPYRAPRFGLTWRPTANLAVRGAAGGGFSLPQLSYLTGSNSGIPDCSSGYGYCTETLANLSLQPEKSFSFDVGADARLHQDTMISVDLYRTNLYGQFYERYASSSSPCSTCNGLPLYVYEYENLVPTRYEGINLSAKHDPGSRGVFWNGGLGLTRSFVRSVPPGFYDSSPGFPCSAAAPQNCSGVEIVPGINFTGANFNVNGAEPYANGNASIGFRWNPNTSLSVSGTYLGPNNAYYRPAFVVFNADASYGINKHVIISATFKNLLNTWGGTYLDWGIETQGAPAAIGQPFGLWGMPWGPRTAILTLQYKE